MSYRAMAALDLFWILVIGVGVWFIDWRAALIIVGVLGLIGSQGIRRKDEEPE